MTDKQTLEWWNTFWMLVKIYMHLQKKTRKPQNKIGYIPIEKFFTEKIPFCESPKHLGHNLPAFAVLALESDDYPDGLVQMICKECWEHFDRDMGSLNWNLMEL